jgi:uncharacterized protein (TIGR03437 family)
VVSLGGTGLATAPYQAFPPFPTELAGVQLRSGGIPVPIAGVSTSSVSYPVPWDLPDSPVEVEIWVSSAGASPFVSGFLVTPSPPALFVSGTPTGMTVIAAHDDFGSLVSTAAPARPGEIIHVYAKDLGVVNPAPPAGLPSPLQPLSPLSSPMACTIQANRNPAVGIELLYAGLAPGLSGVFQVDVRLPTSLPPGADSFHCNVGSYPLNGAIPLN